MRETLVSDLRAMLRMGTGREAQTSAAVLDSRTLQSSVESGERAGYDGAKRKRGSKVHMAVGTLGHLLASYVTPADETDRKAVRRVVAEVQAATGRSVEMAFVD